MHDRVRRIAERADAYEHEPGYGQQQRQDGDTQREMRDVAVIGGGAGALFYLMACRCMRLVVISSEMAK